ncbi:MAG: hypothetical protein HKN74_08110 [Acidimicrobiia bacterium]|nr:FG-GAP repeat protein [Acidimicrobiia bacterium]MBT8217206.1 FG-GAP repeat protein [Acidimicrobiia bacterium]NNF10231.1 hypothetical protein [Acidimicrobiia bacterium]NNL69303.1 hypothetical protein [Acidimicrobiia bacterium]
MRVGRSRLALAAGFALLLITAGPAGADFVWDFEATFNPSEPADAYGRSVALDGSTLVTGAPLDDTLLPNAGAAWVHERGGEGEWSFVIKLNAADGAASDQLGADVAVDGDTMVAGAPFADEGAGAVYVFNRSPGGVWSQTARLSPSGTVGAVGFGSAVELAGNTVVIGAPADGTGSAYVFNRNGDGVWSETTRLVPADAELDDRAGTAVALSGDTILVGASLEDTAGTSAGAVYAFVRDGAGAWNQQAKLFASDAAAGDLFGDAVDLVADIAVIGARGNDDAGSGSGSAYVFTRSQADIWSQQVKLTASDATAAALFGGGVALDGSQLVVGAPGAGRAYVYEGPLWPETFAVTGTTLFGGDAAIDGEVMAVAAQAIPSGSVSVYRRSEALEPPPVPVGVFDPLFGEWTVADDAGGITTFFYGVPGDVPLVGDWDCDGDDTVGMFRPSDGFVYLRNSNTFGTADISFWYGVGGDVPFVGDWDGDGCDTLAIYRNGRVYIRNTLDTGVADLDFFYGIPTDVPFAGDWDGDGDDTVGLYRPSTGYVFLRNNLSAGFADLDFFFGQAGDRVLAADWDRDGTDTVSIYRPDEGRFYISNTNATGFADFDFRFGVLNQVPVAGVFVS